MFSAFETICSTSFFLNPRFCRAEIAFCFLVFNSVYKLPIVLLLSSVMILLAIFDPTPDIDTNLSISPVCKYFFYFINIEYFNIERASLLPTPCTLLTFQSIFFLHMMKSHKVTFHSLLHADVLLF